MVDPLFAHHALTPEGQEKVKDIRDRFSVLLTMLLPHLAGGGRYESMVRTKLEEACIFAIKAVTSQPSNQQH